MTSGYAFPSVFDLGWALYEDWASNDSVADGLIGKLAWEIDAISAGADTLSYGTEQGETYLRMTGGGGDTDGSALSLKDDAYTVGQHGGYMRFRFRLPDITGNTVANNNLRLGLTSVVDDSEPVVGIWMDIAGGVVELDVASANGDLNVAASGPTDELTSGTTLILGRKYNAEIRWHGNNGNTDPGPNVVELHLNGVLVAKLTGVLIDGAETMEPKIMHTGTGSVTLEADIFGFEAASFVGK